MLELWKATCSPRWYNATQGVLYIVLIIIAQVVMFNIRGSSAMYRKGKVFIVLHLVIETKCESRFATVADCGEDGLSFSESLSVDSARSSPRGHEESARFKE